MTYQPREWQDRLVDRPHTYDVVENPDGSITLIPKPGQIMQEGTPANAEAMNNLETGAVVVSQTAPANLKVGQLWFRILD